jgi:type III secretion system YscC/HrcC family outer membrane pore protein
MQRPVRRDFPRSRGLCAPCGVRRVVRRVRVLALCGGLGWALGIGPWGGPAAVRADGRSGPKVVEGKKGEGEKKEAPRPFSADDLDNLEQTMKKLDPTLTLPPAGSGSRKPGEEDIITRVFPLRYAEARPLQFQQTPGDDKSGVVPGVADSLLSLVFHKPTAAGATTRAPGLPNITPHPTQNAVVIMDHQRNMPFYEQLVRQLDQERPLIEISVAIIDVNSDVGLSWGAELLVGVNGHVSEGSAALRVGSFSRPDLNPLADALNSSPGVVPTDHLRTRLVEGPEFSVAGMIANSTSRLAGRLRMLEGEGKAQVLTRPSIVTMANMEAAFSDDARLFVPVPGVNFASLYEVPVITRIKVIPRIVRQLADGSHQVQLAVLIDDSNATAVAQSGAESNAPAGVAGVPLVNNNTVTTQAVVSDQGSLMVGGRYRQNQSLGESRAPVLGRIPVLGAFFKQKQVNKGRVQRFYLISPRIIKPGKQHENPGRETLWGYGREEMQAASSMVETTLLPPLDAPPLQQDDLRGRKGESLHEEMSVPGRERAREAGPLEGEGDATPAMGDAEGRPKPSLWRWFRRTPKDGASDATPATATAPTSAPASGPGQGDVPAPRAATLTRPKG